MRPVDDYSRLMTFTKSQVKQGKPFEYGWTSDRIQGAFRAISVRALLEENEIHLYEWRQLRSGGRIGSDNRNYPPYAAVSHVWGMGKEVMREMNEGLAMKIKMKRPRGGAPLPPGQYDDPKKVFSDGLGRMDIGWQALRDVAAAADDTGCRFLWLDVICMDEVDGKDKEKDYQINNMANIFKFAKQVIIMVGGMGGVQDVDIRSAWMDRAWTLEESTICRQKTCIVVHWPYTKQFELLPSDPSDPTQKSQRIEFTVLSDHVKTSIIPFRTLLALPRDLKNAKTNPPLNLPPTFRIRCLDGCAGPRVGTTARNALLHYFSFNKKRGGQNGRDAAIFRSMLLRTASNPNDVIYTVQGILGLFIDPNRNAREVQYLFNDLARKMANIGRPAWLSMGSVTGSTIPRYDRTLIPRVPEFPPGHHELPYYLSEHGNRIPSGNLIDDSNMYIGSYSIRFETFSLPHVVCAYVLTFPPTLKSTPFGRRRRRFVTRDNPPRTVIYARQRSRFAIEVGTVRSWPDSGKNRYNGWKSIIFLQWRRGGWIVVGDGVISKNDHRRKDLYHLAIGYGTKMRQSYGYWRCDHGVRPRMMTLRHSYGIVPIKPFTSPPGPQEIFWVGRRGDQVKVGGRRTWHKFSFTMPYLQVTEEMGLRTENAKLFMIVYRGPGLPRYTNQVPDGYCRISAMIDLVYSNVEFVYTDSLDSLLMKAWRGNNEGPTKLSYLATIIWKERVMYLAMRKIDGRKSGEYHIAPAPYRYTGVYSGLYPW